MTTAWSHPRRLHWLKPKWWSKIISWTFCNIFVTQNNVLPDFIFIFIPGKKYTEHWFLLQIFYYVDTILLYLLYMPRNCFNTI